MKQHTNTLKRSIAILMTLAMVLSLPTGITMPRQAQAAGYGLNNPTTDSKGVTTWDCVYFGNYWQNDTNGDGVADENDEKQPIKWRVLSVDGNDAFLLADQNLDAEPYNESYTATTWENCTMRSWLNGYGASSNVESIDYSSDNFIDAAFTSAEQNAIKQVTVVNEDHPQYGTEGGNDTNDKVYLLSIAEVSNALFGFNSIFDTDSDTRAATNTTYVAGQENMFDAGKPDIWWLRSPGDSVYRASHVTNLGCGPYNGYYVDSGSVAVRPALHLNLSASNLWSYADTVSAVDESRSIATPIPTGSASGKPGSTQNNELKNPTTDSNGVTTWDCVYFGNYWQNDTNGDGDADENDAKQPIKWRVLSVDGDDAFLLVDQNLDAGLYNESYTDATWENCTMRSWLNGYGASSNVDGIDYSDDNFIDAAFTSAEQNAIKQVEVVNDDNPYRGTEGGNDTNDKVYLLSISEVSNASYGFNHIFKTDSDTRVATNTAYVAEKDMFDADEADCWWLRSPGGSGRYASGVEFLGYGHYYVYTDYIGVRPALHLNLSSSDLWSYAGIVTAERDESDATPGTSNPVTTPTPTGSTSEKPGSTQNNELKNPTMDSSGVTTWDCVYFGNYWQNDTNGDGDADENDAKQPIKWRVLSVDGDDAFLLADQKLDVKRYNEIDESVTWETCTLRSWLNGYKASSNVESIDYSSDNFIDAAFTSAEQNAIKQVTVVNEDSSNWDVEGGNDTNDKIYLLSIAEVSNASYGFNNVFGVDSKTRVATNTAYAVEKSVMYGMGIADCWWLRSPGISEADASGVYGSGCGYDYDGYVSDGDVGVRPVLHLKISDSDLWSYADTVSAEDGSGSVVTPTPTPEPGTTPSAHPTVSPSTTPAPTPGVAQDTQGTATPSTTPSNTKATLSPAAVGTTVKDKTASYKVVSADKKQPAVAYTKVLKKNASSVTVPDKIKVNGVTYQVKSIAPKAFANNKKLKKITIGKNVTSIGKQAFAGCKKLKKITIKSVKLKSSSIGKNAFKGTAKKLTVKVPKKKYKAYKKFLKKKGNKTVKVTK